jgi:glutamyl-tRNA synthetase
MPKWAHLPLILKPDGHGKLSKRDGDRLGFPVYAMNWTDPKTGELTKGFKELGFTPEAFVNLLAMLGWNDGTEKELFSLPELIESFSIDRVSKAGAKFDFEKAKWYNHEWIKQTSAIDLAPIVAQLLATNHIIIKENELLTKVIDLVKDRCNLLNDFLAQSAYFFATPTKFDTDSVKPKWTAEKNNFFSAFSQSLTQDFTASSLEENFKLLAESHGLKAGELMLPFRVMLVGGKFGPGVFDIANLLGNKAVQERIEMACAEFNN